MLLVAAIAACSAAGCSGSEDATGPIRNRPVHAAGVDSSGAPAFDPRLVDPKLEQAIGDYYRDLRTLSWDANENEIRRSVRLLAIAAERIPYTGSVDVASVAVRLRAASVGGLEGPLQQMSRAFVELAQGPYREGVGVLAAAYAFEHAVGAMSVARARGFDRRAAFEVLGRGEGMLWAIRGAIGRGEVGLVTSAPPPADFEP